MRKRTYPITALPAPKFLAGDPIRDIEDLTPGHVEFCRSDGRVCVIWESGTREWVFESMIEFQPGFEPMRRPRR